LIGSAQLRREQAILQHGSMPLSTDPGLFQQVFGVEMQAIALPGDLSATDPNPIIAALCAAAGDCLAADLVSQPLSEAEWSAVFATLK
jgi:lipoate---protein ligase